MVLQEVLNQSPSAGGTEEDWPAEVEFILSALEAGRQEPSEDRRQGRSRFHVRAELRLFIDGAAATSRVLYTRDVNTRGLGFITRQRLPLGYGGRLRLLGPKGQSLCIDCTLLRCHEAVSGWFEGALYFNREQWAFDAEEWSPEAAAV